ncbi:MAG: helix-turn-helix domain-containing protein [Marinosulfonomonas sp.]|nr:helix-turn-helix domain-containing protein [Marinosulfonomonas sp.]
MAGLAKGLAIIEAFGAEHEYLTVSIAADVANVSRASARRCLLTLTDLGYLVKSGPQFRPTPRMVRLGAAYFETASLPQMAQAHLDRARDEIKESVSLAVLENGHSMFIARAEAERIVSSVARIGRRLPAHTCATGRVLLSSLTETQLDSFLATITVTPTAPATVTDRDELATRIRQTAQDQMAFTDQELEEGMVSIAVPVRDGNGQIIAAMSVSASSARISIGEMRKDLFPILARHAAALSQML